jgi:hypothetical protein
MANGNLRPLVIRSDANGNNLFALPYPDYVLSRSLAANVAEEMTVPSGATFAVFSATADFYANYTTTATVPGDVTDGTASELNPSVRDIKGVTAISVISSGTPVVTVSFYK